ncbi:MAG: sugar phosphate isomerase/epimerase [Armatimonadetes bacterium]|nr:sugar phosphate isomerase/epimerase [Armatimonadota bacterium]
MPSWPITIFADECSAVYAEQVDFVRKNHLDGIDLRTVNGRNVVDVTAEDIDEIRRSGVHIQCIGSPVNKVNVVDRGHASEIDKLVRSIDLACAVDCSRIRIFTPEVPPEMDREEAWAIVMEWMQPMVDLAKERSLILLIENDSHFYGAHPVQAARFFDHFGCDNVKAAFDFANTVMIGYRPFPDWFPWILPHTDTIHIKDAVEAEHRVVPAGEGDGQVRQTLAFLRDQGWSGTLTIEPHLQVAGPFSGFSGVDLSELAVNKLRAILDTL